MTVVMAFILSVRKCTMTLTHWSRAIVHEKKYN